MLKGNVKLVDDSDRRIVAVDREGVWYIEVHSDKSRWPYIPLYGQTFTSYTQAIKAIEALEEDLDNARQRGEQRGKLCQGELSDPLRSNKKAWASAADSLSYRNGDGDQDA